MLSGHPSMAGDSLCCSVLGIFQAPETPALLHCLCVCLGSPAPTGKSLLRAQCCCPKPCWYIGHDQRKDGLRVAFHRRGFISSPWCGLSQPQVACCMQVVSCRGCPLSRSGAIAHVGSVGSGGRGGWAVLLTSGAAGLRLPAEPVTAQPLPLHAAPGPWAAAPHALVVV